jgi:choline dehydrogenase-like flavoprotein
VTELSADAVVVGTGAGGAAVAAELAAGGLDVVVLEEGARHDRRTFTARPRDMTLRLYRDAGQLATIGTPPIVLPIGRAVGGTTLINSGTCFRTPASCSRASPGRPTRRRWPRPAAARCTASACWPRAARPRSA